MNLKDSAKKPLVEQLTIIGSPTIGDDSSLGTDISKEDSMCSFSRKSRIDRIKLFKTIRRGECLLWVMVKDEDPGMGSFTCHIRSCSTLLVLIEHLERRTSPPQLTLTPALSGGVKVILPMRDV